MSEQDGAPTVVDARGLLCPLPVIRLQQRATTLRAGDRVEVLATDPGVRADIPAWCRVHGHTVESAHTDEDAQTVRIRVRIGKPRR